VLRRKKGRDYRVRQLSLLRDPKVSMQSELPSFASTPDEIRTAVEQNAIDRGVLLIQVIVSLRIDALLNLVDELARSYDKEDFYESAVEIGIRTDALKCLDEARPPVPYPYYFCTPDTLVKHPELVFYYRNVAMLSRKVMRGVGLDTESFEERGSILPRDIASELASDFNRIVSDLVLEGGVTPYRHIVMMTANLGDSLGGTSRNEVGRVAMMRVLNPLVHHLHAQGRLSGILYSLKGCIVPEGDSVGSDAVKRKRVHIVPETDIDQLLEQFEAYRVVYHELQTSNGSRLLLNRQLKWQDDAGETHSIGPDLHSHVGDVDMLWAGELKGGADPAGSDEHWKTATQALDRILQAAEATGRPQPMLSFIATILVDRVATDAQSWIEQGKLTSVYNLTQMYEREEEMEWFLSDMTRFLGYDVTSYEHKEGEQ